jgi:hypothetical protein
MDRKVVNALDALNDLQKSISGDTLQSNEQISLQINQFVSKLNEVMGQASLSDENLMAEIPIALFEQLDQIDEANPEIFQNKLIQDAMNTAEKIKQRSKFLEVRKCALVLLNNLLKFYERRSK